MTNQFSIDENAVLSDGDLLLALGITPSTLAKARTSGRLRYTRKGKRVLYLGRWVLDWIQDSESKRAHSVGGEAGR